MRVRKNLLETKEFFWIIRSSFLVLALWASCSELFVKKGKESCQNRFLRDQKISFLIKTLKYSQMFVFLLFTIKNSLRKFFSRPVKRVHVLSLDCKKCVFFIPSRCFHRSCTSRKKAGSVVKTELYLSFSYFFLLNFRKVHKCLVFWYLQRKTVC